MIETLNFTLALGGVGMLLGAGVLVFDLYTNRSLEALVRQWGMLGAFFTTLLGSALTLVYSEIFGFVPCGLCWFQRIFLYPQLFILGVGLYIKDKTALIYAGILCIPGIVFALYQHYLQMGGTELVTCPTTGGAADCAERILFEFGFMTFPLLSAITFIFLLALYFYIHKIG